jgi:hypothetical protein
MKTINLNSIFHNFNKTNLVTKFNRKGESYDEYKCTKCGMIGKRYGLSEYITVASTYSDNKVRNCTGQPPVDQYVGKMIRISNCTAFGKQFGNLTPVSMHKIVTPPEGYFNGDGGVWVQGVGELVKVLFSEFDIIEN